MSQHRVLLIKANLISVFYLTKSNADTKAAPDKYLLELLLNPGSLNEIENAWF